MNIRVRRFACVGMIGVLIVGLCWGCAGIEQKIDSWQSALREKLNFSKWGKGDTEVKSEDEVFFLHTSRWSGETLDNVAEWYTGDSENTAKLAELNPNINPDKLAVGSEVVIPNRMLKTREPLPRNFSSNYREASYKHTVRWPGESLSLIASWYTGSSKNWRKLAKVNPRLNPNRIKGGNVIMIPSSLLKTRVPLPQKVAAKYTSDYFAYKVKEDNEKLEDIARWYTGNSANRSHLARANPDLNPNHLTRGNEVYIPPDLLNIRKPAPSSKKPAQSTEPAASLSKPPAKEPAKVPASEPEKTPDEDDNIKLFGPKQFPKN